MAAAAEIETHGSAQSERPSRNVALLPNGRLLNKLRPGEVRDNEIWQQRVVQGEEITKDEEMGRKNIQIQMYDLLFSPV